ncbi:MAG TPA: response regulator [Holophaga sp.]|nr:response regulator [Holophaga sp.]
MQSNAPCREASGAVLLIEDEAMIRVLVRDLLELNGFRVLEAVSGEQALALAGTPLPPLAFVITDHTMPGMDGCDTLAALRTLIPDLRAILVSGFPLEDCLRGRTVPDCLFLAKPFTIAAFEGTVKALLETGSLPVLGGEPATACP